MFEWSDTDLIMRDTIRRFIDKEIRPTPRRAGNR